MTIKNICNNCQILTGARRADRGHIVFSYGTPVLAFDCSTNDIRLVRLWDGWSATTQRHINKALDFYGMNSYHINKEKWQKMEVEMVDGSAFE